MEPNNVVSFPQNKRDRRRLGNPTDRRLALARRIRHIFGWLLLASLVLFFALHHSLFSTESIRRMKAMLGSEDANQTAGVISLGGGSAADAATLPNGIALLSSDTLTISSSGAPMQTSQLSYSSPTLTSAGEYVLAYDTGGFSAALSTMFSVLSEQTLKSPILSASVCSSGRYALVTDESGYRAAVTVYAPDGKQVFKWASPDYYFQSAALSPDGKTLAVTGFRQSDITLESFLFLRDVTREDHLIEIPLGNTVGLAMDYVSGDILALVGDDRACFFRPDGSILSETAYSPDDLAAFAFGDNLLALAQRSYSGSARSELTLLSPSASAKDEPPVLHISEELQSLAISGRRIAVLTTSGLYCYSTALEPLWKNEAITAASRVLLNTDGAAWVIFNKQAVRCTASSDHSEEFTDA